MTFAAKLGYLEDDQERAQYEPLPALRAALSDLLEPYAQWRAPLLVQNYSDCVERSTTSRMRARRVMQRAPEDRDRDPMPELPSARWAYWQYLESIGRLGDDPGTQPWDFIQLLNRRGWCAETWMPYPAPGETPPLDAENAPPIDAFRHAYDQRGRLRAHLIVDKRPGLQLALRADLGVLLPFACDHRIVQIGEVPNDPEYVWNFDESSGVAGWHMIQVEGYHPTKGLLCPNTWGAAFGFDGYVWIGWDTVLDPRRCGVPIAIDWVPEMTDEPTRSA